MSLSPGTISVTQNNATSVVLASTGASGGVPPYTYTWSYSSDGGVSWTFPSPDNGTTSQTIPFLKPQTAYQFRQQVTDAAFSQATSNILSDTTASMPEAIVELIAQNINSAVQLATGYYSYTPVRPVQDWPAAKNAQVIIMEEGKPIPTPLNEVPTGWKEWNWPFTLTIQVLPTEDDIVPIDQKRHRMFADVTSALLVDVTRGGYAIDTMIEEPEFYISPQGYAAVEVLVSVQFRTLYLDAYHQ